MVYAWTMYRIIFVKISHRQHPIKLIDTGSIDILIMCEKFVLNNLCTRGLVRNSWTMFRFRGRDGIWVFCKNGEGQCQMYEYPNWGALKNAKAERTLDSRTFISTKKVLTSSPP